MKYYIPVIGWLIAAYEHKKALREWEQGGSSEATWTAYYNTTKAFVPTMLFLVSGIIILTFTR